MRPESLCGCTVEDVMGEVVLVVTVLGLFVGIAIDVVVRRVRACR